MAVEMGLGTCGVCQSQIGEGVPIGVLSHVPFIMGHKDCVDKRKAENLMVKISKQDGPAGPIGEYRDAVESTDLVESLGPPADQPAPEPLEVEPIDVVVVEPEPVPPSGATQVPAEGFLPESYPALTVDFIPYTSNPVMRPDPDISIQSNGWAYIHVGNVRVAIPDREEWDKLVAMMEAMWNTHAAQREEADGSSNT